MKEEKAKKILKRRAGEGAEWVVREGVGAGWEK
jgi:hypothetical protein